MYEIYADNILVYSDVSPDQSVKLLKAQLVMEVNSAGSLTMTVPIVNSSYNSLRRFTQEIRVFRDDVEIWSGRINEIKEDFYKNKLVTCEGALAYFDDAKIARKYSYTFTLYPGDAVRASLNAVVIFRYNRFIHNNAEPEDQRTTPGGFDKSFALGRTDTFWDGTDRQLKIDCGTNPSYLDIINKTAEILDAVYVVRRDEGVRKLDFLPRRFAYTEIPDSEAYIDFGENLLDYTKKSVIDDDNYTVLIPLGDSISAEDYDDEKIYSPTDENGNGVFAIHYIGYAGHVHKCKYITSRHLTSSVYSTSRTYNPGDKVIYSNSVYQCKETTSGEWDSGKWDKVKIPWNSSDWWGEVVLENGYLTLVDPSVDDAYDDQMRYYNATIKEAVATYGVVEKIVEFPAEQRNLLREQAEVYVEKTLGQGKWNETEIEIKVIELHNYLHGYRALNLLDKVHVYSRPHGLDAYFPVDKMDIDILDPENTKYTFNKTKHIDTLSGFVAKRAKE